MSFEGQFDSKINDAKAGIKELQSSLAKQYDAIENNPNLSKAGRDAELSKAYNQARDKYDAYVQTIKDNMDVKRSSLLKDAVRHPSDNYGTLPSKENTAEMRSLIEHAENTYQKGGSDLQRLLERAKNMNDTAMIRAISFVAYHAKDKGLCAQLAEVSEPMKRLYEFEESQGIFMSVEDRVYHALAQVSLSKPSGLSQQSLNDLVR